jgi:hypothetical protein
MVRTTTLKINPYDRMASRMKVVAQTLKWAAYAAIGIGVFAAPAKAQFDYTCITGSYQVCASVRLSSVGNTLTMDVWNLEGILGETHTMTSIGLYHAGEAWDGRVLDYDVSYEGSLITDWWKPKWGDEIGTLAGIDLELWEGTRGNDGIAGCTPLPGGTKWATCWNEGEEDESNSFPGDPRVTFTFTLSEHFSLNNVELRWHSQQTGADQEGSLKCDTGGAGDYPPCTAVPEPGTIVLLGTGLAGIAGAARRRRKKQLTV